MKNELVIKHNDLIEARYTLSLVEQKVILFAITKIDTSKEKLNKVRFNVNELAELIGSESSRYSEFRIIANNLMDKRIYLKDRPMLEIRWASRSEYIGDGVIELGFDEELIPYLLQLKSRFTRYQIRNILYLENKHSIRIYELMKQYQSIGKREFEIEELKKTLMIEGQYERIYDLKRFVIDATIQEINEHTDIHISYDDVKKGRKIIGFIFKIESKDQEQEIYIDYLNQFYNIKEMQLKMGLSQENFNSSQIINVYELAVKKLESEEEKNIFEYVRLNYLHIKDKARNKYSYLMKALEDDYARASIQISLDYYI